MRKAPDRAKTKYEAEVTNRIGLLDYAYPTSRGQGAKHGKRVPIGTRVEGSISGDRDLHLGPIYPEGYGVVFNQKWKRMTHE
jgi:hypothetical protein